MYVKSLHIYDFRCFGKAVLDLQYPGRNDKHASELPNVNLILGDNGGGKSSVLRALAIAVLAPVLLESGFVPHRLVRRPGAKAALLKMRGVLDGLESGRTGRSTTRNPQKEVELLARIETRSGQGSRDVLHMQGTPWSPLSRLIHDDMSPAFFLVGYGATRRVETGDYSESSARKTRGLRYQRVAGLFEDHIALRPLQAWFRRLRGATLKKRAIQQIDKVLPENIQFTGKFDNREEQFIFVFDGRETPFSALSDGYKAFIGWVTDLIGHLLDVCPDAHSIQRVPGIVLVDEIDLHLHPEWQRAVVPSLAKAFPCLQFVFTSHSPLVASTVRRENVFVTDSSEDGTATIKQLEERVYGRSAEQLLLSSYFGLKTTRPESFQDDAQLLFQKAAEGDSNAALTYLTRLSAAAAVPPKPHIRNATSKRKAPSSTRGAKQRARR